MGAIWAFFVCVLTVCLAKGSCLPIGGTNKRNDHALRRKMENFSPSELLLKKAIALLQAMEPMLVQEAKEADGLHTIRSRTAADGASTQNNGRRIAADGAGIFAGIGAGNDGGIFAGIGTGNDGGIFAGNDGGIFAGNAGGIFAGNDGGIFAGNDGGLFAGKGVIFTGKGARKGGIFAGNGAGNGASNGGTFAGKVFSSGKFPSSNFVADSGGSRYNSGISSAAGNDGTMFVDDDGTIFVGNDGGIFDGKGGIFAGNGIGNGVGKGRIFAGNGGIFVGKGIGKGGIYAGNGIGKGGIYVGNGIGKGGIFAGNGGIFSSGNKFPFGKFASDSGSNNYSNRIHSTASDSAAVAATATAQPTAAASSPASTAVMPASSLKTSSTAAVMWPLPPDSRTDHNLL